MKVSRLQSSPVPAFALSGLIVKLAPAARPRKRNGLPYGSLGVSFSSPLFQGLKVSVRALASLLVQQGFKIDLVHTLRKGGDGWPADALCRELQLR